METSLYCPGWPTKSGFYWKSLPSWKPLDPTTDQIMNMAVIRMVLSAARLPIKKSISKINKKIKKQRELG